MAATSSTAAAALRRRFADVYREGRRVAVRGRVRGELLRAMEDVERDGLALDKQAYRQALDICRIAEQGAVALDVLQRMQAVMDAATRPDLQMYNSVLDANAARGDLPRVHEAWKLLRARGIPENQRSYGAVIACLGAAGDRYGIDAASRRQAIMKLFLQARKKQKLHGTFLYNKTLSALETWSHATDVLKFMKIDNVPHDVGTYNALLKIARGNAKEAEHLHKIMKKRKIVRNVGTFTTLITAYAREGRYTDCVRVLQEMYAAGVEANAYTYAALLAAYVPHHHEPHAVKAAEEWAYSALNTNKASEQLWRGLMRIYAARRDAAAAENLRQVILENGFAMVDAIAEHYQAATGRAHAGRVSAQGAGDGVDDARSRAGEVIVPHGDLVHTKK